MTSPRLQDAISHIEARVLEHLLDDKEEDPDLNHTGVWVPEEPNDPLPEVIGTLFGRYRRAGEGADTSKSPPQHYARYVLPYGASLVQRNGSHLLFVHWCRPPSIGSYGPYLYAGEVNKDA